MCSPCTATDLQSKGTAPALLISVPEAVDEIIICAETVPVQQKALLPLAGGNSAFLTT
jgi:hypothetical protein